MNDAQRRAAVSAARRHLRGEKFEGKVGVIVSVARYTRDDIRNNPKALYVFGDNLAGSGFGGQAREARGEPNAVGVITKRYPSMAPTSFLNDADLPMVRPLIQKAFRRLADHLRAGGVVVWPKDGVGTGLAHLAAHAPAIDAFIVRCHEHLKTFQKEK